MLKNINALISGSPKGQKSEVLLAGLKTMLKEEHGFAGMGILYSLIGVVVTIIVLAKTIPVLWPMATEASGNITAMEGTDEGTQMMIAFWPIVLLIIGLGVAIAVIVFALRKFNVMGGD